MAHDPALGGPRPQVSRRSLRLTFRLTDGVIELESVERLPMITPLQFGDAPRVGTDSGNWIELRGADDRVLAHRVLGAAPFNSVEVHSPDGRIERRFGPVVDRVFEVLLPDVDGATEVLVVGQPLVPKGRRRARRDSAAPSDEIARFELPASPQAGA